MNFKMNTIPIYGIGFFILLYIIASYYYPGGNVQNTMQKGFDWIHNYWCDLIEAKAINGERNIAQPLSLAAFYILLISLGFFFFCFPKFYPSKNRFFDKIIVKFGILSLVFTSLITTDLHNYTIGFSSFLGLIALLTILKNLKNHAKISYYLFGWFSILILVINNLMFYTRIGEWYLPLMQKIGFATVLFWIAWVSYGQRKLKIS